MASMLSRRPRILSTPLEMGRPPCSSSTEVAPTAAFPLCSLPEGVRDPARYHRRPLAVVMSWRC